MAREVITAQFGTFGRVLAAVMLAVFVARGIAIEPLVVCCPAADDARSGRSTRASLAVVPTVGVAVRSWTRSERTGRGPTAAER